MTIPPIFNQEAFIVLQLLSLCVIAVVIGLILYSWSGKSIAQGDSSGIVGLSSPKFQLLDFLGVTFALSLFITNVIIAPFSKQIDVPELSNTLILSNMAISQLFPLMVVFICLASRFNMFSLFGLTELNWKRIAYFVIGGFIAMPLLASLAGFMVNPFLEQVFGEQNQQAAVKMMLEAKERSPELLIGIVFFACIVAPICEEIVFRGYFYGLMKRYSSRYFAAITTGVIFGVIHGSVWAFPGLVVVGVVLAILYELSGSLLVPIICHALFNTTSTIFLVFFVNASDLPY